MSLDGRVALITGGAGHIGSVIAEAFVELGAKIAVIDVSSDACAATVESLNRISNGKAVAFEADLASEESIRAIPARLLNHFARLDIVVHCAAYVGTTQLPGWCVPFVDQSLGAWDACLGVNVTAPFLLTQSCAPALIASSHGSVINVSSIYGLVGPDMRLYENTAMGNPAAYGASKGGLLQLTRYLAAVLAPRVRVNAISPGGLFRDQVETFVNRYVDRTPMRRMATEEDIKGAAVYLASDLSNYVTGHNLVIDGGWSVW